MNARTRVERAVVRPVRKLSGIDAYFDAIRIRVDGELREQGPIQLLEDQLSNAQMKLVLPSMDSLHTAFASEGVDPKLYNLVVRCWSKANKLSKIIMNEDIGQGDMPFVLELERGPFENVTNDRRGFWLTVALVLKTDVNQGTLMPRIAGTWLSRADFSLGVEYSEFGFNPDILTDHLRASFGLEKNSVRYIEVDGVLDGDLDEVVHVYLDEIYLEKLLKDPASPAAIYMQTELASLTIETIAATIVSEVDARFDLPFVEALAGVPECQRFFDNLCSKLSRPVGSVAEDIRSNPGRFKSLLESRFRLGELSSAVLKEA